MMQNHLNKMSTSLRQKAPCEIWWKLVNWFWRRRRIRFYPYIAPPYKSIQTQIWPCRKKVNGQPMVIIWTNLVDLESSMLYTKIQPQSFLGSGEEDFQEFYHIWAWWPSCSIVRNHLNKMGKPFRQKANMKSIEYVRAVSEKNTFKTYTILCMYIAKWQGQITLKGQNFDYN